MGAWLRIALVGVLCLGCGSSERSRTPGAGGDGGAGSGNPAGSAGTVAGAASGQGGSGAGSSGAGGSNNAGDAGAAITSGSGGEAGDTGAEGGRSGQGGEAGNSALPAACPRDTSNHTQGSRVRGKYAVTADGLRAWKGWHDSELGVDCEFFRATDGTYRCMPNNYEISDEYFLDETCTLPVYTRGKQDRCVPMDFVFTYEASDCTRPLLYHYYELGTEVTPEVVYVLQDGDCSAGTAPAEALFEKGEEVPPSRFVEGAYSELVTTGRIRSYGIAATDGLRQVRSFHDTELGIDTDLDTTLDGRKRFVPSGRFRLDGYADAVCSSPLARAQTECEIEPEPFALKYRPYQCQYAPTEIFEVGALFEGGTYVSNGETCSASTAEGPAYLATPAAPETFQATEPLIDESAPGRVKPLYATTPEGGCWFDGFWDTEFDHECAFAVAEDRVMRCLPTDSPPVTAGFSDDACSERLDVAWLNGCNEPQRPRFGTASGYADNCVALTAAWELADARPSSELPQRWVGATGSCSTNPIPNESEYRPATHIEPERFVPAEMLVE